MRVWISGCGGMMGSHLCEALREEGHDVAATYYKPTIDVSDLRGLSLEEVDIRDWCSVTDSLSRFRPDAVFHLAAQSYPTVSWQRPVETLETNVIGTANIFEAVKRLGTKVRVIVAGSSAEYGTVDPAKVPISEITTKPLIVINPNLRVEYVAQLFAKAHVSHAPVFSEHKLIGVISKTDLDSEMTVVRNEFEMGENDPGAVLFQRAVQLAYLWHNYRNPVIGARSDIEHVPIERLQAFYRNWYQPDNAVLIIAGYAMSWPSHLGSRFGKAVLMSPRVG